LAQQLQKHKANLHHNVIFIAFTGEEKGLLGSNHFAKTFLNDSINVSFMINMDMVGRLDSARRLAIYGIGSSPDFSEPLHSIQEPKFTFVMDSSGIGPSDHTSFYLNDIPVLHFFTGQHEQYHRPEDDLEHINFEGLKDVSDFIFQLVLRLDKKADLTFTETKSSEKQDQRRKFKVTLGVIPDYLYDGEGLKIDGVKEGRTADLAGMKRGDIVVQLGSLSITNIYDYMHALQEFEPGTEATALIVRNGEEIKLDIVFDATTGEHSNH
jgi:hypothetical protein